MLAPGWQDDAVPAQRAPANGCVRVRVFLYTPPPFLYDPIFLYAPLFFLYAFPFFLYTLLLLLYHTPFFLYPHFH